jgi:hypothetical protein
MSKIESIKQIETDLFKLFNKHTQRLKNDAEIYINCSEENKIYNYYGLIGEMEFLLSLYEDIKKCKEEINKEINKNIENITSEDLDILIQGV